MKINKQAGISLIVLVITIIIMIILAAAIIITLQNTGIINTAENGVEKTNNKQTRLELELVLADLQKEKYGDKKKITDAYIDETLIGKDMLVDGDVVIVQGWLYIIDREKLVVISDGEKAKLNKSINITAEASTTDYKTATITINISGIDNIQKVKIGNGTNETEITELPDGSNGVYTLTHSVTENGTYSVTVLDNNGGMNISSVIVNILEQDLVITSKEELVAFRDMVNKGATFEGKTITLAKDIDLNPGKYSVGDDGIIVFAADAEKWTPIGNYASNTNLCFKGTFDGNNHEISGLYVNTGTTHQGLFGYILYGTIKNLELEGVVGTSGYNGVGLLVGFSNKNIDNVTIKQGSKVIGGTCVGGIVGQHTNGIISNVKNYAVVQGTTESIAGIAGWANANSTIKQASNYGNIVGNKQVGGIVGGANMVTISLCNNTGSIRADTTGVGGILGADTSSSTITQCYNTGNINGYGGTYTYAGGIAGWFYGKVTYSYNKGPVYGKNGKVGGIIGDTYGNNTGSAQYCYNTGDVVGSSRTGSILGNAENSSMDNCFWTTNTAGLGYSGSATNSWKKSVADMKAYTNEYFVADTIGVNDGYPILKWQLEVNK